LFLRRKSFSSSVFLLIGYVEPVGFLLNLSFELCGIETAVDGFQFFLCLFGDLS
jgi:hypothetical protein